MRRREDLPCRRLLRALIAMLLSGIDVSSNNGPIDWPRVAEEASFAWMKATEGATFTDPRFVEHWSGALFAGVQRSAYHFFTATSSPEDQAAAFLRVYPGAGELPPLLDLERGLRGAVPSISSAMRWIEIIARELGVNPMIYLSPAFAEEARARGDMPAEIAACDLMIADWREGVVSPRVPWPWSTWRAWQMTSKGRVSGITGPVDRDVLRAW